MTGAEMEWTVVVDGRKHMVCSFKQVQRCREHVEKHFCDKKERWKQVAVGKHSPMNFTPLPEPRFEVGWVRATDEAAVGYVKTVQKATVRAALTATRYDREHGGLSIYAASTSFGIFSVFRLAKVSDLRTAYRPIPRALRGTPSVADFGRAAREKFLRKIR